MLQNQRPTKNLYRIDSNTNLYRIDFEVFTQQVIFFDAFTCEVLDFVEIMFFLSDMRGRKVLDFVEGKSLPWRAEIDLVEWPQGTWRWGPLQNQGSQHPPQIARGILNHVCLKIESIIGASKISEPLSWHLPSPSFRPIVAIRCY